MADVSKHQKLSDHLFIWAVSTREAGDHDLANTLDSLGLWAQGDEGYAAAEIERLRVSFIASGREVERLRAALAAEKERADRAEREVETVRAQRDRERHLRGEAEVWAEDAEKRAKRYATELALDSGQREDALRAKVETLEHEQDALAERLETFLAHRTSEAAALKLNHCDAEASIAGLFVRDLRAAIDPNPERNDDHE